MIGPILFIGDSVTDCGRREDAPDFLGDGYVRMRPTSWAMATCG